MGNISNNLDITKYLGHVKSLLNNGMYDFVPRRKNMESLSRYGLTFSDAKNEIMGLTINDYYKGPKCDLDSNRPGDIWEFKKTIEATQFYIKLKIVNENAKEILKCIGFHEDEFI